MEERIFGSVVGLISCLMCAIPFFIVSKYEKDSKDPITFWSGDKTLKKKVNDVKGYNGEMAVVYRKCAWAFVLTGVSFFFTKWLGIALLIFDCSLGIYIVYRCYKKILAQFS